VFGSKKNDQFAKGGHTLFDHALEVEGDVRFTGVLDIEGTVKGNIEAVDGRDALIRIREKGCVLGDIKAPKIIINGKIDGNVYATEHLELAAKALVNGNVHYKVIEMVKGSEVNGSLVHVTDDNAAVSEVASPASSQSVTATGTNTSTNDNDAAPLIKSASKS